MMKNCPNCNSNLPGDSEFCVNCGARLSAEQNSTTTKKGVKGWQIILIVLAVLLIIGISVGATYFLMKNNETSDEKDDVVAVDDEDKDGDEDDGDKNKPDSDDNENDLEEKTTSTTVPDTDEDNNLKSGEIVIGVSGPLTGVATYYGNEVVNGAQLAVDEINANGGIDGMTIKLIIADDEADTGDKAESAYNSLKNQGMQIFLGPVTSGSARSVIDNTKADNMFQLTPTASADDVIRNNNCFSICYSDSDQGARSAQYIAENNLATKVGVIYDASDAYSTGIFNAFKKAAAENNLEIVAEEAFTMDSNKDFSAQILSCKTAGADLIFLPIYYMEAALIIQAAEKTDYAPKFFGCDGLDGILSVKNFDTKLAEGVMLLAPFASDADDKATKDFVAAYNAKYYDTPDMFSASGYDAVYAIKAAAERADISSEMSASEICEKMKDAMTYITINGVTGENMSWTADGKVDKQPKAVIIKNGDYVSAD